MLVLTRCLGEEIVIGDVIRVKLVDVGNHRVRLGISAPKEVSIYRDEIHRELAERKGRESAVVEGTSKNPREA